MAENQDQDARAVLLEQAWAHPQARAYLEEAFHISHPKAEIPGRSARLAVQEVITKVSEKEKAVDAKLAEWDRKRDHEDAVRALKGRGYNDEQVTQIEKLMVDEGIGTHMNAAVIYDARNTVATPRTVSVGGMSPKAYGKAGWAKFFGGTAPGRGIMDGDFHTPGKEFVEDVSERILSDFSNGLGKKWLDDNYWPDLTQGKA